MTGESTGPTEAHDVAELGRLHRRHLNREIYHYSTRVARVVGVLAVVASLFGYFSPHRLWPAFLFALFALRPRLGAGPYPISDTALLVTSVYFEAAYLNSSYAASGSAYLRATSVAAILIFAHGAYSSWRLMLAQSAVVSGAARANRSADATEAAASIDRTEAGRVVTPRTTA